MLVMTSCQERKGMSALGAFAMDSSGGAGYA
jgi:hypothetical protein